MRVALYGRPTSGLLPDLYRGMEVGEHSVRFLRDSTFTPDQRKKDVDLVVVNGLRGQGAVIRDAYCAAGIPVAVIDSAHLRRDRLYYRISFNDHAWLPTFACPSDRLAQLDVEIADARNPGECVLLCGQVPGDTQHGLGPLEMRDWLASTVAAIREQTDRPIVWRPHPQAQFTLAGVDITHTQTISLAESLAGARAVVTYNSTCGLEALIAGAPVWSVGPSCYRELSERDLATLESADVPSHEDRVALLSRVAYAQWQIIEAHDGLAAEWLCAIAAGADPFSIRESWTTDFAAVKEELTSWSVEAHGVSYEHKREIRRELSVEGIKPTVKERLREAGLWSTDAIRSASDDALLAVRGVGPKVLSALRFAVEQVAA